MKLKNLKYVPLLVPVVVIVVLGTIAKFLAWIADELMERFGPVSDEELDRRIRNANTYGTSHPEFYK